MTPAEVLAAAADKLEALADAATDGPWKLSLRNGGRDGICGIDGGTSGYDDVIARGDVRCGSYCYGGTSTIEAADADWHYIAAMNPLVGKALAEWLLDEMVQSVKTGLDPNSNALALARLIVGGES